MRYLAAFIVAFAVLGCQVPSQRVQAFPTLKLSVYASPEADTEFSDVFVDGQYVGNGELLYIPLALGRHTIKVELLGYEPFETEIYLLEQAREQTLHVRLVQAGDG